MAARDVEVTLKILVNGSRFNWIDPILKLDALLNRTLTLDLYGFKYKKYVVIKLIDHLHKTLFSVRFFEFHFQLL